MKKALARLLASALLCGLLTTGAAAATLQSGQAVYQLSLDPLGTEPFSYSDTETYSATLVPIGTSIQSDNGAPLLVEIFTYRTDTGHWALDSLLSGQSQAIIRDADHLYHIATLSDSQGDDTIDRGIWLKAPNQTSQPISATGEPVDEWALNLVNQAIADGLMPDHLKGKDLREPITRLQFAALAVRLYETASGQTIPTPEGNPFSDTTDPEALKAYSMGFTAGVSDTTFGPSQLLTREQASVMLTAVYEALGGTVSSGTQTFTDSQSISPWALESVTFMAQAGIVSGYGDGRFGPQDTAQRQACLIMALRIYQNQAGAVLS